MGPERGGIGGHGIAIFMAAILFAGGASWNPLGGLFERESSPAEQASEDPVDGVDSGNADPTLFSPF